MSELVEMVLCRQCGQTKEPSRSTPGLCLDCEKAYNARYSYMRRKNEGWMDVAKASGLELWERQPGETQLEWTIWQAYRDSYPGAKPSYRKTAEIAGSTYEFVKSVASRWNFQMRMQAWIAECDRITVSQRRQEVLDMNKAHITMAAKLRAKIDTAIDGLVPEMLSPKEINSLLKTMADLERRAQMDSMSIESMAAGDFVDNDNPELKKSPTKQSDISEVLGILLSAGALGDITHIGVRKTETTEVVVGDAQGNSNTMIQGS